MTNPFAPQQQPPPQQAAPGPVQPANQGNMPQQPAQQHQPPASTDFGQPSRGSGETVTGDDWKAWAGSLVLFECHEFRTDMVTKNTKQGETTKAVLADVHVIDVVGGPLFKDRVFVFPPALVTALTEAGKQGNGARVLGRINQYVTKAGRETVELVEHTQQDAATAGRYLEWRASQSVQQPAPQQQQAPPPQPDPWQSPPPQQNAGFEETPPF